MSHFIIVYASHEGQTQKVAHHVARQVENLGHTARLINVGDAEKDADAGDFDAAVIAGDLDSSERAAALAQFVQDHKPALEAAPCALLSVRLEAGMKEASGKRAVQDGINTFEEMTSLRPDRTLPVGGAYHDRGHSGMARALHHVWMHLKGITPDPSGHTELTDWQALEAFIREFITDSTKTENKETAAAGEKAPARAARKKSSAAAKSKRPKRSAPRSKNTD